MRRILTVVGMMMLAMPVQAAAEDGAPAKPPREKRVCRNKEMTGSHVPRSVCHTASEWEAIAAEEKANAQRLLDERKFGQSKSGFGAINQ